MLITDAVLSTAMGLTEALVPAKCLLNLRRVRQKWGAGLLNTSTWSLISMKSSLPKAFLRKPFFPGPVAIESIEIGVQQEL